MLQLNEPPQDLVAWERFLELGAPKAKSEAYRYVHLQGLYKNHYHIPRSVEYTRQEEAGTLVFVNGIYCPQLSQVPKPIVALPLSAAFKIYGSFLQPRMQKLLKEETDPFAVLNGAYHEEGLFLYLPPKYACEMPLKIVHLFSNIDHPTLCCPRIHLFAGKEASASIVFSQDMHIPDMWTNALVDIALEEGAQISLTTLCRQHASAHMSLALRATLKSRSIFNSYEVTNGGATSRHDYSIRLLGAGAHTALYGVWDLKEERQHHVHVLMEHQEPTCHSLQKFKGVLSGTSRSSFEGKIYVAPIAQKTEAYQMNNNLILDIGASANVKPNLEIYADDVKASHGATVGHLDSEHLFYLRARGCSLACARALLIRGFTQEIIDCLPSPTIKQEARLVLS